MIVGLITTQGRLRTESPASALRFIGSTFPQVDLLVAGGETADPNEFFASARTVVFLVTKDDCLSCGQYVMESKIIDSQVGIPTIFVGVGPDTEFFARFFQNHRVRFLLDPEAALLSHFDPVEPPLVTLVGSDRRILWMDARSPSMAARYPSSRVLLALTTGVDGSLVPFKRGSE